MMLPQEQRAAPSAVRSAVAVSAQRGKVRTAVSAMHTDEQIDKIGDAMAYALKKSRCA
jgi:hypothetical protein